MREITFNSINELRNTLQQYNAQLIAVSKTVSADIIRECYYSTKQFAFAENYVDELINKTIALNYLPLEWHFIGSLQTNKCKLIANCVSWVHGITSLRQAQKLNNYRQDNLARLQVLIQVNISHENSKHGLETFNQVVELAKQIETLPNLQLRGLMGMATNTTDQQLILSQFQQLASYQQQLNNHYGFKLDHLSMGMSADYLLALQAGSTMVRIGSSIFGKRSYA
ncbi:MAG: hypothetical protein RLZZ293_959 [Pseudomonadota bacterium]|jgi:pyridoxal phosphate enzyme (YggS family)